MIRRARSLHPLALLGLAAALAACTERPTAVATDDAAEAFDAETDASLDPVGPDGGTTDAAAPVADSMDADATVAVDTGVATDAIDVLPADTAPTDGGLVDGGSSDTASGCKADADCPAPNSPCLLAICAVGGVCKQFPSATGTACSDGDACTLGDTCNGGACAPGGAKPCADDNACTTDTCQPVDGACAHTPSDSGPCDDGVACTIEDSCKAGQCVGGLSVCACIKTSDCAKFEDGDFCNGTLFCDTGALPNACKLNPSTPVTCQTAGDTACTKTACEPTTGKCQAKSIANGGACDDGDACTAGDVCASGQCAPGKNVCVCQSDADCSAKDDGDKCNGVFFCNKVSGKCDFNPGTIVSCPTVEDTLCRKTQCQPLTGECVPTDVNQGLACLDNNPCTVGDVCEKGLCKSGKDTCACTKDDDCTGQDDGDFCNGTMFCNLASKKCEINPVSVVKCPSVDDTFCMHSVCQPKSGKCAATSWHESNTCDDDKPCTTGEVCTAGVCGGGADTCKCTKDSDCAAEEDGNQCNGTLFCDKGSGKCLLNAATAITCPSVDDAECIKNQCNPKSGKCVMAPVVDGSACEADDSSCTIGDTCAGGVCKAGNKVCECAKDADCVALEDGNACNGTLYCQKGAKPNNNKCVLNPASTVYCPTVKDTTCGQNQCKPVSGTCEMTPAKDGTPCDDASACTSKEACDAGICQPLVQVDCDDGLVCTSDSCNPVVGCVHVSGTAACDLDGTACTADKCKGGVCLAGAATDCDDKNACTNDLCDDKTGACSHDAKTDGASCSDEWPCTVAESCKLGKCNGKPAPTGTPCGFQKVCGGDQCNIMVPKGFLAVPAGAMMTGYNPDKLPKGSQSDDELRRIYTDGFFLNTTEVTVAAWQACVQAGKCSAPDVNKSIDPARCTWSKPDATLPVNCISKAEAAGYCSGMFAGGRLPTMVEWLKAARGGCDAYGSTDCAKAAPNNLFYPSSAETSCAAVTAKGCSEGPTPAGSKPAGKGPYGHMDLLGNLAEWVLDGSKYDWGFLDYYDYQPGGMPTNPVNPYVEVFAIGHSFYEGIVIVVDLIHMPYVGEDIAGDGVRCLLPIACDAVAAGFCEDGNPCTVDFCIPGTGCSHSESSGACESDGNVCTEETCVLGACKTVHVEQCDDTNPCTLDLCNPTSKGCSHAALAGSPCTDGQTCTEKDVCVAGQCAGTPLVDAAGCDDSNACTTSDVCNVGKCVGAAVSCGSGLTCQGGGCITPKPDMTYIPGGEMVLGCNEVLEVGCTEYEKPAHKVKLSPYWLQTREVTRGQYAACLAAGACGDLNLLGCQGKKDWPTDPKLPVTCVDWAQGKKYCAWKYGTSGNLPSEAQWEYAARGPCTNAADCAKTMRIFPWGNDAPAPGHGALGMSKPTLFAPGSFPAGKSPFGVDDMAGNVAEWVLDTFMNGYYLALSKKSVALDPSSTGGSPPLVHGGSAVSATSEARSSARRSFDGFGNVMGDVGFRCAISTAPFVP